MKPDNDLSAVQLNVVVGRFRSPRRRRFRVAHAAHVLVVAPRRNELHRRNLWSVPVFYDGSRECARRKFALARRQRQQPGRPRYPEPASPSACNSTPFSVKSAPGLRFRNASAGSTLLLALWALLMLSAIVFAWTKFIRQGLGTAGDASFAMQARALAHSGVAVALDPAVSATTPLLNFQGDSIHSYHATIEGEGVRINLNFLLAGEDPNRILVLKQYLALRGLTPAERDTFVDCLLDWVSPPGPAGAHRLNGAGDEPGYHPTHKPLASLDELYQIKGTGPLLANAKWKDDLTLLSSGPLDMECVSAEILSLVPGVGLQRANHFVDVRQGPDHMDHTKDDHIFTDLNECFRVLGVTAQQQAQFSGVLGFRDPTVRIHCVGVAGKIDKQVDVVTRKVPGANPEILQWTEK